MSSALPMGMAQSLDLYCILYRAFSVRIIVAIEQRNSLLLYLFSIPYLSAPCFFSSKSIPFKKKISWQKQNKTTETGAFRLWGKALPWLDCKDEVGGTQLDVAVSKVCQ